MLGPSGRLVTIYPADRMTELLAQMHTAGIEPKFLRVVHSRINTEAKRVIVEGKKGGRSGITIGPPLIIYGKDGSYSEEVAKMFHP